MQFEMGMSTSRYLPARGTAGLARSFVKGNSRVPAPPPMITDRIRLVFGVNIDFISRHVQIGGPSTQWWTQLATAIAGGLTFATLLTLVVTPALLLLGEQLGLRFRQALPRLSRRPRTT